MINSKQAPVGVNRELFFIISFFTYL